MAAYLNLVILIVVLTVLSLHRLANAQCSWGGETCTATRYQGDKETKCHKSHENFRDIRCCVDIPCFKGTMPVICELGKPDTTTCRECKQGSYQPQKYRSSEMRKCDLWSLCDPDYGLKVGKSGTESSDVVCECDVSLGYWTDKTNPGNSDCRLKPCQAGSELKSNGECAACEFGQFKSENGTELCRPWTQCAKVREYGTTVTDSECEPEDPEDPATKFSDVVSTAAGDFDDDEDEEDGLRVALIVIVIFLVVAILVIAALLLFCWKRNRSKEPEKSFGDRFTRCFYRRPSGPKKGKGAEEAGEEEAKFLRPPKQDNEDNDTVPTGQYNEHNRGAPTGQHNGHNPGAPTGQHNEHNPGAPAGQHNEHNPGAPAGQHNGHNRAAPTGQHNEPSHAAPAGQHNGHNSAAPAGQHNGHNPGAPTGQHNEPSRTTPPGQHHERSHEQSLTEPKHLTLVATDDVEEDGSENEDESGPQPTGAQPLIPIGSATVPLVPSSSKNLSSVYVNGHGGLLLPGAPPQHQTINVNPTIINYNSNSASNTTQNTTAIGAIQGSQFGQGNYSATNGESQVEDTHPTPDEGGGYSVHSEDSDS